MLSKGITACPRSAQDIFPLPELTWGGAEGAAGRGQMMFLSSVYCTFKSIRMCLTNRTDKNVSVYSWIPAREAV